MTDQTTRPLNLDDIEARAAHLDEYALLADEPLQAEADQLTGEDVPALIAEVHRLQAELADFSGRVNELESQLCECQPTREHDDFRRPAFYQHEAHCPAAAAAAGESGSTR